MTLPIFERDGDHVVPTAAARGPWDERHCHGGAPSALLAALVDAAPTHGPMQVVRLTFDLLRPVPLAPLTTEVGVVRDGKRIQLVEASLTARDGTPLVRCRALRMRRGAVTLPADAVVDDTPPLPPPDELPRFAGGARWSTEGFWHAVDVRFVAGALGEPGPGTAWFRVEAPLLEGVALTPAARAAAAADFGNGIGPPLPMGPFRYVNGDLTVHLHRLPVGPWVGLQASSVAQPTGVGLATSTVHDRDGRIGLAAQSLFVDAV